MYSQAVKVGHTIYVAGTPGQLGSVPDDAERARETQLDRRSAD